MARVALSTDSFTTECPLHILLKAGRVLTELSRCFMIERVVGVWLEEEENQAHDDVSNIEYGLPVCSQNIQAHVAICVDVRMVDVRIAMNDWGFVGILGRNSDREVELSANP